MQQTARHKADRLFSIDNKERMTNDNATAKKHRCFTNRFRRRAIVFCSSALAVWSVSIICSFSTDHMDSYLKSYLSDVRTDFSVKGATNQEKPKGKDRGNSALPLGLQRILERANKNKDYCGGLQPKSLEAMNTTDLPELGIASALSSYKPSSVAESQQWQCEIPPENECEVNSFTVIFLGYNPERLASMNRQIRHLTSWKIENKTLVEEVILVWNGPRELSETAAGKQIEYMAKDHTRPVRIIFPLKMGYPNDLLNRYNPQILQVKTKSMLYYDDDGPFYTNSALLGGFELWKRNSDTQVGAMARSLDIGKRQQAVNNIPELSERDFVPHCRSAGDTVFYNYYKFAQFGANMVLPSGTFIHSNYLCFIWHPALEEVREFVRAHPVHPDDATVSTIVSQVSGRAPKVYSRRLPVGKKRRLEEELNGDVERIETSKHEISGYDELNLQPILEPHGQRRKLLWEQEGWGNLRNTAVNSLTSYFGSLNSGSVGWCNGTEYQKFSKKDGYTCDPDQAKFGQLPWMTEENKPLKNGCS